MLVSNASSNTPFGAVFPRFFVLAMALLAIVLPASSQTAALMHQEPNRVLWPVTPGNSVQIEDRLPAYVRNFAPTGKPSPDTMLTNLMVLLSRSPQTQAAFDQFVLEQQDPSSPNFHHFLTPITVGQRFGPTMSDVQAVTSWLGAQGLQVDEVSPDMTRVVFHGTVANVSSAFNVEFGTFNLRTAHGPETRLASLSAPSVPMALTPVVQSIVGLYADPLVSYESGNEFPNITNSHAMTPASFSTQYSTKNILAAGYTGQGVRVAILGYSRVLAQDVTDFMTSMSVAFTYLNTAALPNQIVPPTGTDPGINGNQAEQTLDVTRVMSTAPGAIADLVVSGTTSGTDGLIVDLNYEVNTLIDPVLTMSYGGCETVVGLASVNTYATLFQTAVAEGITPMVAAGDSGAECGNAWTTDTSVPTTPIVGVNWLCANSYVTCVGGTSLNDQPQVYVTPAGKGAALTANITSGSISSIAITSGGSGYATAPAIRIDGGGGTGATATATLTGGVITGVTVTSGGSGYKLPSTYWNDSGTNFSTLLNVVPEGTFNDPETIAGKLQVGGSTGGFSTFAARPSFQTTALAGYATYAAAPFAGQRLVPDISVSADVHDGYFMCLNLDCESGNFRSEAGTSGASPGFAGIIALVVNRSGSQGWFNPTLYSLASSRFSQDFNDVTSTSAGVASCSATVPSHCNNDEPYLDGSTQTKTAYTVGTGYDVVTGWGSVNAYNMLLDLRPPSPYNSVTYTATTTTFHSVVAITFGTTLSTSLNATTKAGSTDVTALGVEGYFATVSGGAPVSVNATTLLTPGTYTLTAIWQPTAANGGTYSDSYATVNLTVNKVAPTVVVTATSSSINLNASDDFTATVTGVSGGVTPSGTVQFYDGSTKLGSAITLSSGKATLSGQVFTTGGSHTITAQITADANYLAATSNNFSLTVIQNTPTVTATATPSTITTGGTSALAATVTSTSGTPSGTVQFYDGAGTVGSPVTLTAGNATLAAQTFTTVGAHSITAKYSGDTTYLAVTSLAATLTVNKATPTATATAAASSININATDNLSVTVTSAAGTPTGSVQFYDGVTAIGSAVTLSSGAATLTGQAFTTAGAHSITAVYSGDSNFTTVTSTAITITVNLVTPTLNVIANPATLTAGGTSSLTVTVTSTVGTPTGSVQFYDGVTAIGSAINLTSGSAALAGQTFFTSGAHSITAQYSGDATFQKTTSTAITLTVNPATAAVALTAASPTAAINGTDSFTVTVTGSAGTPTGTVQFYTGTTALGSPVALSAGAATSSPTFTILGAQSITAQYSGDANYAKATSAPVTITVGTPTVTLTVTSGAVSVPQGNSGSVTLTATSTFGYAGSVPLSCSVALSTASASSDPPVCHLNSTNLTITANGSATTSISVSTTAAHATQGSPLHARWMVGGGGVLACLMLCIPLRRRRVPLLLALMLAVFTGAASGCSSGGPSDPGTSSGSYIVTVQSTNSTIPATVSFTVTVN